MTLIIILTPGTLDEFAQILDVFWKHFLHENVEAF